MPLGEDDTSWQVLSSFSAVCGVLSSAELETGVEVHVVVFDLFNVCCARIIQMLKAKGWNRVCLCGDEIELQRVDSKQQV